MNGGTDGGSNGTLADVAVADWLRHAVVDARDDRMFDAIRDAAGYERRTRASDGPPPAAFTRSTETPPGLGEGCACYRYEAECEDSVRAGRSTGESTGSARTTVVAVVGAAHVNDRSQVERVDERAGAGRRDGAPRGRSSCSLIVDSCVLKSSSSGGALLRASLAPVSVWRIRRRLA